VTGLVLRGILATLLLSGCAGSPGQSTVVEGAGPTELLKMRAGPGLGYKWFSGFQMERS